MQVVTVFDFGCHTFAAFDLSLYEKARVGVVIQVSCSQSHACRRYCKAVCIPEPLRSHALVFVSSVCACYLKQSQKGAAYRFACARSQKKASKAGTLQHQAVLTLHGIRHHASVLCDKTVAWAKLGTENLNLSARSIRQRLLPLQPLLQEATRNCRQTSSRAAEAQDQCSALNCFQSPGWPVDEVELLWVHEVLRVIELIEDAQQGPTCHQRDERIRSGSCQSEERN